MIKQENCIVLHNREIADDIYELVLGGEISGAVSAPGQFVHLKVADGFDPLLRRPISIAGIDQQNATFTLVYRSQGRGTKLLSKKSAGDAVDILGPLGNGFPLSAAKRGQRAILVGGGVGVPPLLELAKQLVQNGVSVISVLGFQTANAVFYESELARFGEVFVSTVDGSYGKKGFVTDFLSGADFSGEILYACGPTPMLKAVETGMFAPKMYLSLEERMGCGIGACFACVCHTQADPDGFSYKKVCSDGPVFQAGEVEL
jgi:dihydroorotate dehydrogenase electron transfer subunit